ncbi:MAG TPA: DNA-formamidopyrimidine glycosylase [Patescibacteria group bacterium]|nr:DNA-formamidopyrimidine glycosylase [Patescibacteria group bacterium]
MPELPEVKTTVNGLKKYLVGKTIKKVWTDWEKMVKKPADFSYFKSTIKDKKIKDIIQRGKNIVFLLSNDYSLLIHQKLTGHLLYGKWKEKEKGNWVSQTKGLMSSDKMNSYIHFIFFFKDGHQMALSDLRKFAKIVLAKTKEIKKDLDKELGPGILEIDFKEFKKRLEQKRTSIKKAIMDQGVIAGIGNIYSDEALFRARIHPLKKANNLTEKELKRLYNAAQKILKQAIKYNGTSVSDYRTPKGKKGEFSKLLKVYGKDGEKCPQCSSLIEKVKVGSRTARFCPKCQKKIIKH